MSEIQSSGTLVPFNYGDAAVRVVMIDGDPWFVLADLCKVLGLTNPSVVAQRLAPDALSPAYPVADNKGRVQNATLVNESGMYEVVIRSDKPEAVTFRRWITGTVLPEIRRTGSFNAAPVALPDRRALAQMVIEAEDRADEAERQKLIERKGREAAESYARELEPKAEYVDNFVSPDDCILFRTLANQLDMQETALRELLTGKKWIYRTFIGKRFSTKAGRLVDEFEWRAYAEKKHFFRLFAQHNAPRHHNNQLRQTLYVTPVGAQAIRKLVGADPTSVAVAGPA